MASLNGHITKAHSSSSQETDDITKVMEQLSNLEKRTTGHITRTEKSNETTVTKVVDSKIVDEPDEQSYDVSYLKLADSSVDGVIRRYVVKQTKIGDTRVYICSYCDKQFKKPSDLIRHIRVHTREKPFKVFRV